MTANELRLGNWVHTYANGEYQNMQVYQLDEDSLNGFKSYLRDAKGIPLTPDLLEKCGYRIERDAGNWHSPDHTIWTSPYPHIDLGEIDGTYLKWNPAEDDFYSTFGPRVEHLHHLQNLTYALTGEELKIEL